MFTDPMGQQPRAARGMGGVTMHAFGTIASSAAVGHVAQDNIRFRKGAVLPGLEGVEPVDVGDRIGGFAGDEVAVQGRVDGGVAPGSLVAVPLGFDVAKGLGADEVDLVLPIDHAGEGVERGEDGVFAGEAVLSWFEDGWVGVAEYRGAAFGLGDAGCVVDCFEGFVQWLVVPEAEGLVDRPGRCC